MIIILPLGHEVELRRVPKVTFGLIIANVIIFLITYFAIENEFRDLGRKGQDILKEGLKQVILSQRTEGDPMGGVAELTDVLRTSTPDQTFEYIKGKLSKNTEQYQDWLDDYELYKKATQNMIIKKIGFVPADFPTIGFFTHMFIHAGWLHIIFNMWFLYLAGCCLEDRWGRFNFIGFYFLGGIAAASLEYVMFSKSQIPMVGASGAVAAAMGAFAIRYGKEGIDCFLFALIGFRPIIHRFMMPAWVLLFLWFGIQLFYAEMYRGLNEQGGVAFWAHVGGFVFGACFAGFLKMGKIEEKIIRPQLEKLPEYQDFSQDPDLLMAFDMIDYGKYTEALAKIETLLLKDTHNPDARNLKARLLFLNGFKDQSSELYMEIMQEAKTRGMKNLFSKIFAEFRESFPDKVLPDSFVFAAARAFFDKGDIANSENAFLTLIGKSDTDPDVAAKSLFYLGRVRLELQKMPDAAKIIFKQFLDLYPAHAWTSQAAKFYSEI